MNLASGNILQMVVKQRFIGQQMLNVFHWQVPELSGETFDLEDVCQAWVTNGSVALAGMQSASVEQISVKVTNLSQADYPFFEKPYTKLGVNGGANLPSNTTITIKQLVGTSKTRSGSKRIGGITTAQISGNTVSGAGFLSSELMRALCADKMIVDDDTESNFFLLQPIILKKYDTPFPLSADYQDVTGAIINPYAGSQNSRKEGYGS